MMAVAEEDKLSSCLSVNGIPPATAAEEKRVVREIFEAAIANTKEGDEYFLVNLSWWRQWSAYVDLDEATPSGTRQAASSKRPFCIDNSVLVANQGEGPELREALYENQDFVLLPEQVWTAFQKWYGGGPAVARKVICTKSIPNDTLAIEIYPLRVHVNVLPGGAQLMVSASIQDTVGELYRITSELLKLGIEQIRIWDYSGKLKHGLLMNHAQTLEDADFRMDHEVLVEIMVDEENVFLKSDHAANQLAVETYHLARSATSTVGGSIGKKIVTRSSSRCQSSSSPQSSPCVNISDRAVFPIPAAGQQRAGITGLQNLGNTCFLNSALQCLAHTPQIMGFFLQDFSQEINHHNVLGMEGALATTFGDLLRQLWVPGKKSIAPRAFKAKLARFAPQFSGHKQHDTQELLAFLLDGLHEDLNRVKLKPFIEPKDTEGRSDDEVAEESWRNHKARNDSIIVDTCQGQYKSTLVCPVCDKVSVTFDPFMYLSLPLSASMNLSFTLRVFSGDGSAPPTLHTITLPKPNRCKDLMSMVVKVCSLQKDERLVVTEPDLCNQLRLVEDNFDWIKLACNPDYVTAHRLRKTSERTNMVVFTHRTPEKNRLHRAYSDMIWPPLVTLFPEEGIGKGEDLLRLFTNLLRPFRKGDPLNINTSLLEDTARVNSGPHLNQCLFQFWLAEQGPSAEKLVLLDLGKPLPSVRSAQPRVLVVVEWFEKALQYYDVSQFEVMPEAFSSKCSVKIARQDAVSLHGCLEAFLREEPLGPEDMWYCPVCKVHQQARKKLDLWRLPEILVLHLKRFSFSRYLKDKLEVFVDFPIHGLDLSRYVKDKTDAVYELYAVTNHYGSMGGGHYTAYVKVDYDHGWYNFDDNRVYPISENEVKTSAAYVLFYQRTGQTNGAVIGCSNDGNIQDD